MMSDVEPELPDGSLEEPEFMEEAKISGSLVA